MPLSDGVHTLLTDPNATRGGQSVELKSSQLKFGRRQPGSLSGRPRRPLRRCPRLWVVHGGDSGRSTMSHNLSSGPKKLQSDRVSRVASPEDVLLPRVPTKTFQPQDLGQQLRSRYSGRLHGTKPFMVVGLSSSSLLDRNTNDCRIAPIGVWLGFIRSRLSPHCKARVRWSVRSRQRPGQIDNYHQAHTMAGNNPASSTSSTISFATLNPNMKFSIYICCTGRSVSGAEGACTNCAWGGYDGKCSLRVCALVHTELFSIPPHLPSVIAFIQSTLLSQPIPSTYIMATLASARQNANECR